LRRLLSKPALASECDELNLTMTEAQMSRLSWRAVRPLGNVLRDPFQNELADQIRRSISAGVRQSIEYS
jgi:hypothetical protein